MWDPVGKGDTVHQQFLQLPSPIRASSAQAEHFSACCSGTVPARSSPALSLALLPSGSRTAFCLQPVLQWETPTAALLGWELLRVLCVLSLSLLPVPGCHPRALQHQS